MQLLQLLHEHVPWIPLHCAPLSLASHPGSKITPLNLIRKGVIYHNTLIFMELLVMIMHWLSVQAAILSPTHPYIRSTTALLDRAYVSVLHTK